MSCQTGFSRIRFAFFLFIFAEVLMVFQVIVEEVVLEVLVDV